MEDKDNFKIYNLIKSEAVNNGVHFHVGSSDRIPRLNSLLRTSFYSNNWYFSDTTNIIYEGVDDFFDESRSIQPYFNEEQKANYERQLNIYLIKIKEHKEAYDLLISTVSDNANAYKNYLNREAIEFCKPYIKIFTDLYGENRVDYSVDDGELTVIVHYPEINIVSENGLKHTIYDLYVRFNFNVSGNKSIKLKVIRGIRSSMTPGEINIGYQFSHLQKGVGSWSEFCFGTSNVFVLYKTLTGKTDELNLQLFLEQFESYLSWESITGTPYRYIRDISDTALLSSNSYINNNRLINDFIKDYSNSFVINTDSQLRVTISTGYTLANLTEAFNNDKYFNVYGCYLKDNNDAVIVEQHTSSSMKDKVLFSFKNNPVKFKVLNISNKINLKKSLRKEFLNNVFKTYENIANNYIYQKYIKNHEKSTN